MEKNYPKDLMEFEARFATEAACREYLMQLRWPDGFVCPRCQAKSAWSAKRERLICAACRYQASAIAGTIFQDTRKPFALVVPRHVVRDQSKERSQRDGAP